MAFNLPADVAAPSKVSNCFVTDIRLPTSIPVAFAAAAMPLNTLMASGPYLANSPAALLKSLDITSAATPI